MKAIRVHQHGGPEKLIYDEVPVPEPGAGEVRVKIEAIGLNFVDMYRREGLYKGTLPLIPGDEAAGVVDAVGPEVTEVQVGQRVAYAMHTGTYAEYTIVPAWKLVPVPETISQEMAVWHEFGDHAGDKKRSHKPCTRHPKPHQIRSQANRKRHGGLLAHYLLSGDCTC